MMPPENKDAYSSTVAGCCLAAASGFTFGQRHHFADAAGHQDVLAIALWLFLVGVLVAGIAKDILGARIAIGISGVVFLVGAAGPLSSFSILCLAFAGGLGLAICNGLCESSCRVFVGRWLNLTHAFYRLTSLVVMFFMIPIEVVKWLGLAGAGLAVAVYRPSKEVAPVDGIRFSPSGNLLLLSLLALNFLAGAFELWSEKVYVDALSEFPADVATMLAGMMFLGRLAASTPWFSGNRQLVICSLMASLTVGLFPFTRGEWQFRLALVGAFFSASIFPTVLGMLSVHAGRWRGTACSFGQISCMLAALLTTRASGIALFPGISLALISLGLLWSSRSQSRR